VAQLIVDDKGNDVPVGTQGMGDKTWKTVFWHTSRHVKVKNWPGGTSRLEIKYRTWYEENNDQTRSCGVKEKRMAAL
jgi:hypothetical protein